ncbi:M23 family metallopeptidase [Agromyces cerinus]|uniref:Peptidase family M23 n=1 Tax=Agromyces cerinus subsp. cerinus TaxID=232089 RepID=A0A1N6DZC7_9MICO|nr:M23 family metallopeptidase [Agromyces cerinus]SIN76112.1 Peptidase family M23 [Agromyces cerinus subsp. cerinus]
MAEKLLALPFTGTWMTQNSPARRVPSHGVDLFGERYAIDFVAVDLKGRSSDRRDWRTFLSTEPAERFLGFGQPILAPVDGVVAAVHDGELDHDGRRSQLALVPYALGQAGRLRQGVNAIAGNTVTIAIPGGGAFVSLAHLRLGSIRVAVGDRVASGQPIAECGNSGNSTEPHVHLQVMNAADPSIAEGLPMTFGRYRERRPGSTQPLLVEAGIPGERSIVEPVA